MTTDEAEGIANYIDKRIKEIVLEFENKGGETKAQ